ncbi:hypothetical protein Tco_1522675 [Tanacetum coccineum]
MTKFPQKRPTEEGAVGENMSAQSARLQRGFAPAYMDLGDCDQVCEYYKVIGAEDNRDTLKGIPSTVGVSARKEYHASSLAVPRKAIVMQ